MTSPKFFIGLIVFLILVISIVFYQQFLKEKPSLSEKTVLFLCVHNTFRSQIAEAYLDKFAKEKNLNWQAESAGFLEADKINEKALILMKEEGIDISDKKPKLITDEMLNGAEKIIVVCKECQEQGLCLNLPKNKEIEYWKLENPAEMELDEGREIRDLIKEKVLTLLDALTSPVSPPEITTSEESPEVFPPEEEPAPTPETKETRVIGTEFAFNPSSITVQAGERVKIIFENRGEAPHNLVIESLGVSTKTIGSGKTDIVEFTASASGTYPIVCSVPGHRAAGMEGSLEVK